MMADTMTSSVVYYSTNARQNEIYLFYTSILLFFIVFLTNTGKMGFSFGIIQLRFVLKQRRKTIATIQILIKSQCRKLNREQLKVFIHTP